MVTTATVAAQAWLDRRTPATTYTAYPITWAVLTAAFARLLVYRRMNLAAAVGLLISMCTLVGGVILDSPILARGGAFSAQQASFGRARAHPEL